MATYTYPGVYIQEVPKGPGPVQAASASTCAMIGYTDEGPVNEPTLVTSFPEFSAKFGSFTSNGRLPTAAFAYFQNGGQNLVVVRTVGVGASSAAGIIDEPISGESAPLDPAPNGATTAFSINLSKTPVVPGSVSLTAGGVAYTDNGSGGIIDAASVVRGSIDYVTGEITLNAAAAIAGGNPNATVSYSFANITFTAKSEGAWGNDIAVEITGDNNSLVNNEFTAYIVSVKRRDADGRFVDVEVFNDINFTPDSANFIEARLNDSRRGSDLVSVSVGSAVTTPADLRDISTTETRSVVPAPNGVNKVFGVTLAGAPVKRDSFTASWHLGTRASFGAVNNGTIKPVRDAANMSYLSITLVTNLGDTETHAVTQGQVAGQQITTDITVAPGNAGNELNATLTLTPSTGAWTLVTGLVGTNNPAITSISMEYVRANALKVKDDGTGEIVLDPAATIDADISLLPAGPNTIDYATGAVSIAVDIGGTAPRNLTGGTSLTAVYTSVNSVSSFDTALAGGSNGAGLLRSDVSSPALAGDELGLYALNRREDLLNVCIPDFASNELVSQDLIDYCETRKDRFAIISAPEGYSYTEAIDYKRSTLLRNSSRAAMYYPHVKIIDPVTDNEINFPAVAHMAGIYARTDSTRNVSKAPAGTVDGRLAFCTGLEVELTPQQAGFVNQACINNLVSWSYTGLVAWGARTLENNGDFPYIQMRRLFMFVEKSVFNSTQGFVFESNTGALRAAIKLQIEAFLLGLHRSGHFAGNSPAQSFFVICDSSNNPQAAIDQGQLVVDVGIAPTKPAEFVIFRFQQKTVD